jgi:crotonobetainyl-CoA:carnitine CoA-transferase CaiB-like acyl-CoA transferase
VPPLSDLLLVDLTRYLPGAYAGLELQRLGARVVRIEAPDGDPLRRLAPRWHDALNAGKESVACDLKHPAGRALARALLARADIVLEGFRPGVADRLGVGPAAARAGAVYCSITGFGDAGAAAARVGHDLNYAGWAGALADTAPGLPPIQIADLAGGALAAVAQILAALLEGRGARITISMTHEVHRLVAHRARGDPRPKLLTGGVACYRIYPTADGRFLTVAALEERFWRRLCELVGLPALVDRRWEPRLPELERRLASRPLAHWLERFDGEDVGAGPVVTIEEAAQEFGLGDPSGRAPSVGEHTDAWRAALDVAVDDATSAGGA